MIISITQTKGGTGKSTLALSLAFSKSFKEKYDRIALLEFDQQGSIRYWWQERLEYKRDNHSVSFYFIPDTSQEALQKKIKSIALNHDLLIMDMPGESTGKLHTTMSCSISDTVIIPMRSSNNDESALARNLLPLINNVLIKDRAKAGIYKILPTFVHPSANSKTITQYFNEILPQGINCLDAVFPSRSIYENFNRDGMNLHEFADSYQTNRRIFAQSEKAIHDIEVIARIVLNSFITK
jgi:cellulose biosynthesis protein BcsQ